MPAARSMARRPAGRRELSKAGEKAGARAAGPRPLTALASRLNVAPQVRNLAALQTSLAAIQRVVSRERSGENKGKWYSSFDETTYFNSLEEARAHEHEIQEAHAAEKERIRLETLKRRYDENAAKMKTDFPTYKAPASDKARLYKNQDRLYDDVALVKPTPEDVKSYSERIFAERKAGQFETQVMRLGGDHFVLQPGTDIGLTPADLRPDLDTPASHVPLSREGQPKTYPEIAHRLDDAALRLSMATGKPIGDTRSRMGKDLDRFTRGNPPAAAHPYAEMERRDMQELAAVLRLDKGRVRKATKVIRKSFTSGEHSFQGLLAGEKYPGAGKGGVERLRQVAESDGYESEGSDIDEERKKKGKRQKTGNGTDDN